VDYYVLGHPVTATIVHNPSAEATLRGTMALALACSDTCATHCSIAVDKHASSPTIKAFGDMALEH